MNDGKAFFDTNILLYMYGGDSRKRMQAIELFQEYTESGRMLLSTQVVQEFYAAGSRKLGIPRSELLDSVEALLNCPLITIGAAEITAAIQIEERYRISFWDALIVAAAESGGAEFLLTEDLSDGQRYGGIVVRNPFGGTARPSP